MDRYIGRLLDGRYEILEIIGTGGMAVVYKARCHRLNRLVAIKILKDEYSKDEEFRHRFHAESQAVAMLSNPNIVSIYDVSTSDDADYIVMELIDGITLKQYMEKKGVLNWKETLHFAIQIAKALEHAHSRGIIHRDIKPHNVMVLKNGAVKVADFGIAQVMSKSSTLTKEALGSVHYISPEQAKGGRVDNRSDLYSLGVVMYEMMTGRPPYDGESPVAVAIQHINGKAAMPSTLNPNIPGGLEQIIMKAMAQDPNQRYVSAQAMLDDMDEFRKNPGMLFDYNNTSTSLDDAAVIVAGAKPAAEPAKKPVSVPGPRSAVPKTAAERRAYRRQEEIVEEKEKGSKVATIAIAVCAVVALAVIGVCIWLFMSMGGVDGASNKISLPNFTNATLEEVRSHDGNFKIEEKYQYNDTVEQGRIIDQSPKPNAEVNRGSTVTLWISQGPEPEEKLMENFVGLEETFAMNFLVETQGVQKERVSVIYEASSQYEKGIVIRTEPGENAVLPEEGIIRLYVSSGPDVETKTLPDFVKGGFSADSAQKWLADSGFNNVDIQYEANVAPKGSIFYQSVGAGKTVNVNTRIVLKISLGGNAGTTPADTENMEPADYIQRIITVTLPTDRTAPYLLTIYRENVILEERTIPVGTVSAQFQVSGKDVMSFILTIDGQLYDTVVVDFNAAEETTNAQVNNGEQ